VRLEEPSSQPGSRVRSAPTSAQAAPAFATGGVLVRVAVARTAAFLIDPNRQSFCVGVWKFLFLVTKLSRYYDR
jgi:hypothetical protein